MGAGTIILIVIVVVVVFIYYRHKQAQAQSGTSEPGGMGETIGKIFGSLFSTNTPTQASPAYSYYN